MNSTKKAIVASIKYAGFEFDGLRLPDGKYAIAVPQIAELYQRDNEGFPFLKKNASRDIKAILGKDFSFFKIATELNSKKVNILTLDQFGKLNLAVALKGNKTAYAIAEASVVTTVEQAFDIAFDNKKSLEEYQIRLEKRTKGIIARVTKFTDFVKEYIENNDPSMPRWKQNNLYADCSDEINYAVFSLTAKEIREVLDIPKKDRGKVRDYFAADALDEIARIETVAGRYISEDNMHPLQAVKHAIAILKVKQYRLQKIGKIDS